MKKSGTGFENRLLKRVAVTSILLVLVGAVVWLPRSIRSQQIVPQVENKTHALLVVSLVPGRDDYILTLRNVSDKAVNGYSLAVGPRRTLDADLTTVGRVIAPGENFQERIPASNLQPSPASSSLQPKISIRAVIFEDSTGDGEASTIAKHNARRAGAKRQLNNILPLLKDTLDAPDSELAIALERLKAKVESLPETLADGVSQGAVAGLRSAKQDVLAMVQNLRTSSNIRADLSSIKEQIEKRIGRL
jgi:hypothetical protein